MTDGSFIDTTIVGPLVDRMYVIRGQIGWILL